MEKLLIIQGNTAYEPPIKEGVKWETERKSAPGKLTFSMLKNSGIDVAMGNNVCFIDTEGQEKGIFYGFVFRAKETEGDTIDITAYDQLRYLKNKDTMSLVSAKASAVVMHVAQMYRLNVGVVTPTVHIIPSVVEENSTGFDMIGNALDEELKSTGNMYVLFDNYGALTLLPISKLVTEYVLIKGKGQKFTAETSIDKDVYNSVKVKSDNKSTGRVDVYIVKNSELINEWGLLQLTETVRDGENAAHKANALLNLYSVPTKSLKVQDCQGDNKVRGGSLIAVADIDGKGNAGFMIVEKAVHTYKNGEHTMNLTLIGGEYNA